MSQIDAKKFGKMAEALHGILKGGDEILEMKNFEKPAAGHGLLKLGNLRYIEQKIQEKFSKTDTALFIIRYGSVYNITLKSVFAEYSTFAILGD